MAFRRRTKSYPLFSQEFVIHNHADIGFCLVLCVLIGLMFEVASWQRLSGFQTPAGAGVFTRGSLADSLPPGCSAGGKGGRTSQS